VSESPIEQVLAALDRLDIDAVLELFAPDCSLLMTDGRRGHGAEEVRGLLDELIGALRSTTHQTTAAWHLDGVWIAEVLASYELRDWLRLKDLPRVFILREGADGITDLRAYGAHEHALTEHRTGDEGIRIGERWIPPL
jgi:hypothetical protein